MEDALCRFHTFKDIFFLGRDCKKAKPKANVTTTELVKTRSVGQETMNET
jgi:hypothetical protein